MHPQHETGAGGVGVRLNAQPRDLVRRGDERLEHHLKRQTGRGGERGGDLARVGHDLPERAGAVKVLAAGDEPNFGCG